MRQRIKKRPMSEINVVPYIDVMLVLLIIFMVTAPLLSQGVKVNLPQAPSSPLPPNEKEPVIVNIDKNGNFFINYGENQDKPVQPNTLVNRVSALLKYQPDIPVFVGGDREVPYGQVIELMTLLQKVGVPSVGMITDPPEK
tara:strand:- start:48 stop:470 length:423 start_codon:yes stop_codon:yes gene_type:complete